MTLVEILLLRSFGCHVPLPELWKVWPVWDELAGDLRDSCPDASSHRELRRAQIAPGEGVAR